MNSTLPVSKVIEEKVKTASKQFGFEEQEFADRAILFYLDSIEKKCN